MALPPGFLEELRARTPLPTLIGRRVRLLRSGRQWRGCCPFHGEKTPSFYVYDDHYHCFGCGAHGDAISYVMQAEGQSFIEAVRGLAAEAGLAVPEMRPDDAIAARAAHDTIAVLERAAESFQRRLLLPEGAAARAYLGRRGVSEAAIRRFRLGFAPGRGALAADLARDGVTPAQMIAAGLLRAAEDGEPAREFFTNRVMFPITDRRGRVISFGGRRLDDAQTSAPKYLNGPETAVFSKRRTLYNLDHAGAAIRAGAEALVVEGYLDVIALDQAGFAGALAPLGTALGVEHLEILWQATPLPLLCFDGDAAGARAALRAITLALPLITPERSLEIVPLPPGEDPDTLLARAGAGGFRAEALARRQPLISALYALTRGQFPGATPESRSALFDALMAAAESIGHRTLAGEYRRALRDRFFEEFRRPPAFRGSSRGSSRGSARGLPRGLPRGDGAASHAVPPLRAAPRPGDQRRERVLLAVLLHHPVLALEVEEALGGLTLPPPLARLRAAVFAWAQAEVAASGAGESGLNSPPVLDSPRLFDHLAEIGLGELVASVRADAPAFAAPGAPLAEVAEGWWHFFAFSHRERLAEELAAARRDFAANPDPRTERRLVALRQAQNSLAAGDPDETPPDGTPPDGTPADGMPLGGGAGRAGI
jgi:DNA primase